MPKVPDSILRAALLARAQEDITRIVEIRTRKQALSTLLQRGVVGDEIWQRLLRAEQELELEIKDVVQEVSGKSLNTPTNIPNPSRNIQPTLEYSMGLLQHKLTVLSLSPSQANAFAPNWGQTIFQSASEMAGNAVLKKKLAAIAASVEPEKEWWEAKRATTQEDFMRELDKDSATATAAAAEKEKKGPTAAAATTPADKAEKMAKSQSSDGSEEAVLVETPAQTAGGGGAGAGAGGGKGKKKKGKK